MLFEFRGTLHLQPCWEYQGVGPTISFANALFLFQEELLLDPMYDVPGSDIIGVCIDEKVVKRQKKPDYVRSPQAPEEFEGETEDKKEVKSARVAAGRE